MRRTLWCLLAVLLVLTACQENPAPLPPDPPPAPPAASDTYTLTELTGGGSVAEENGPEISRYSYCLYQMETPEDAGEAAQAKAAAFNGKMKELRDSLEASGRSLADDAKAALESGYEFTGDNGFVEERTAAVTVMGDILSIRIDGYSYTGGVHPNSFSYSYVFDWGQGVYIDPVEVADDPEAFRAAVTDKLLDQIMGLPAEVLEGYFTGYEDTVGRWNEYCAVFTESGLEVRFSAYELGPYAMGEQVFLLEYEELSDILGPTGLTRLGL